MSRLGFILRSQPIFWATFLFVYLAIAIAGMLSENSPFGDVEIAYHNWAMNALEQGQWPGITVPFIYPILALLPMLIPLLLVGLDYLIAWIIFVVIINALGSLVIIYTQPRDRGLALCWYWLTFMALLGPVSIGRIDIICVPIAITAIVLISKWPIISGVLLSLGTWIKVWPIAIGVALVLLTRARRSILIGAIGLSILIVSVSLVLGEPSTLFSFISGQNNRALQIESVWATPWLWFNVFGQPRHSIYWNDNIITYEVSGPGVNLIENILTLALPVAFVLIAIISWRAKQQNKKINEVLATTILAFTTALIIFNKVGSVQFMVWLIVPILFGLSISQKEFSFPAELTLFIALLSQIIYPYLYLLLVEAHLAMVAILTARNIALVILFVWSIKRLIQTRYKNYLYHLTYK